MAKFTGGDLRLKDGQNVTWGTGLDSNIWWDDALGELRLDTTISGVYPIQDYQLTTKQYVDDVITSLSGEVGVHNELTGLQGGTTAEYYHMTSAQHTALTDVGGVVNASTQHIHDDRYFREDEFISTASGAGDAGKPIILNGSGEIDPSMIDFGAIDHGSLSGLLDDDHTQYILVDGTRGFTGVVAGITPTADNHLTTKQYVDQVAQGLDWQDSVTSKSGCTPPVSPSDGDRYIVCDSAGTGDWAGLEDYVVEWNGTSWSGTEPNEGFASWVEDEDIVYIYNGTSWVKFGSTVTHNNLSGLQGGTADEYYHMTSTQYTTLTDNGGVVDASAQHIHTTSGVVDFEELAVDAVAAALVGAGIVTVTYDDPGDTIVISGTDTFATHTHPVGDITDFTEEVQDVIGSTVVGAGTVVVTYDDPGNTVTVSGISGPEISPTVDHGLLVGLEDDDHTQYVPTDGSRGFTATVSGIDPVQSYHLATKSYVDAGGIDRHGRESIANGASTVSVTFADLGHTDYTVNATMENTSDSPPSIYAYIVSARVSTGFTVTFMGDMDSANYVLNWSVIED